MTEAREPFEARLGKGAITTLSTILTFCAWIPGLLLMELFPYMSGWWAVAYVIASTALFLAIAVGSLRDVVVGADGVSIVRKWGTEFVSFAEVREFRNRFKDLELLHHDRNRTFLGNWDSSPDAKRLCDTIELRLAEFHARTPPSPGKTLLKGEKDVDAWTEDLTQALSGERYRAAAVAREDVLALAEDLSAKPEARMAAVRALEPHAPEERSRLRVVATETAARRLRIAIEESAQEEQEPVDQQSGTRAQRR